jgi:hypothetical protein
LLLFFKKEVLALVKQVSASFFEKKKQKTFAPFGGAWRLDPLYFLYSYRPYFVS